jgi:hypothetical protein
MEYNFLLIDDEIPYCEDLRLAIEQIGRNDYNTDIVVTDRQNWADGKKLLSKNYYHAIILDGLCLLDEEQETEDAGFLAVVFEELKSIETQENRHIPVAVNTGHLSDKDLQTLKTLIAKRGSKVFYKTEPIKELMGFLMTEIDNSPNTKIFKQYADVFEIFELGFMPPNPKDFKQKLLKILKNIDTSNENTAILQDARVIQEEIYKVLQTKISGLSGSFMDKNKFLSGNIDNNYKPTTTVYQTPVLSYSATAIYQTCSTFGNHSTSKPSNVDVRYWEVPSNYAVKSVVFALLEQLLWFKELIKTLR